ISLYNNPEPIREIQTTGPWDLDVAFRFIERSFKPAVSGGRGAFGQRAGGDQQQAPTQEAAQGQS
ncbi:MAG: hypothetical protein WD939_00455, partial [Dehalococcoidia bacterium]